MSKHTLGRCDAGKNSFQMSLFLVLSTYILCMSTYLHLSLPPDESANRGVMVDHHMPVNNLSVLAASRTQKQSHLLSFALSRSDSPRHALFLSSLLVLSGIEMNPGPVRYPCGLCSKPCKSNQKGILCEGKCGFWFHTKCLSMEVKEYEALANSNISWICSDCGMANFSFSSSFFDDSINSLSDNNFFSPLKKSPDDHSPPPPNCSLKSPFHPKGVSSTPKPKPPPKDKVKCRAESSKPPAPPANTKNSVTSFVVNFCSYLSKKDLLTNLLNSFENPIDIIFGTESWLTNDVSNAELNLDEFDIHRRDRTLGTKSGGGGVFVGIRKIFNSILIAKGKVSETIFVKVPILNKAPLIVCCAYRPPDFSHDQCLQMCNEIREIKDKFKKSVFWLSGDFNLPDIDWTSSTITNHQYSNPINQLFLDLANDLGLSQTVEQPTRGTNILDLFFTNNLDLIQKSSVVPGVSDHDAVLTESKLFIKRKKSPKRKIRLWNKADMTQMKTDCESFSKFFLGHFMHKHSPNVNEMWSCIKTNLHRILDFNIPSKMSASNTFLPWITTQTKRLIKNKKIWFQRAKRRGTPRAWRKYKEVKKLAQKFCRSSHDDYVRDIISDDKSTKKFWSYLRSQRTENTGISDLVDNQKTIFKAKDKADVFNTQFSKVFSKPCDTNYPSRTFDSNSKRLNNLTVTKKGVLALLKNIKEDKATGPDDIPGKLLKYCALELHEIFTVLFQKSLDMGTVPDEWKVAHITPLFKKGDKAKAENYRPISLTCIVSKLLEHIVHSNIMDFLDSKSFLTPFQHGFRQKRSCESQLLTTLRDFQESLNIKGQIDAILLDFSKAFDKVDHRLLLNKMYNLGISGPLLDWSSSFLNSRLQHVIVDGCKSDANDVLSGVPQGTVLGPLFFLIYINDICQDLTAGTSIRLFADDSLLYREIKTHQDTLILQRDLEALQTWETHNKMEFHPGKCQVIRITNKRDPIIGTYNIHGVILQFFNSVKYLGVTIDSKLSFKEQCNNVCHRAHFMLSFLERNFSRCPQKIKEQCYFALVRPLVEYGCTAWDPHEKVKIELLEKVNKRAARFVTGNHLREEGQTLKNMENLGWPPLIQRRRKAKLSMLFRIREGLISIPHDHLSRNSRNARPDFYVPPHSGINSHLHSFFPSAGRLWNSIPQEVKSSPSVDIFKGRLEKITITDPFTYKN